MSRERLQEHFSELYDGSIDPGLAQQIKTRFEGDYDLQADYKGFADTMALLETLKDEQIETPQNLSSMIADRIDSGSKKPALTLGAFWRNLGLGSLACVAIVGAFLSIRNRTTGPTVMGTMVSGIATAATKNLDTIEIKMVNHKPYLSYTSSGPKTLTVVNEADQKLLKHYDVDNTKVNDPMVNPGELPSVFQIEATGEASKHLVVLPGATKDYEAAGQGDLVAFAKLLATKYRVVIHLQVPRDTAGELKWDVSQADVKDAAKAVLSPSEFTITGDSELLVIQKLSH